MSDKTVLTREQENQLKQFEKAVGVTGQVADALIKRDGWTIAHQQVKEILIQAVAMNDTVMAIINNMEDIKKDVADPVGFEKSVNSLLTDLSGIFGIVDVLSSTHENKSGQVSDEDYKMVDELTIRYSSIKTILDNGITGLLTSICTTLYNSGWDDKKLMKQVK